MSALVVDLGGTGMRAATCLDGELRVLRREAPGFLQHPDWDEERLLAGLLEALSGLARELGVRPGRLGMGFPGPVDPSGRAWKAPTLWGERVQGPVDLPALIGGLWPECELHLVNDVTGAGYRYLRHATDDLCVVTVSSGIGHKVFVGGKPAVGRQGRGGELGHLRMDYSPDAPLCDCGGRGHLGALSSGRAVAWQAAQLPDRPAWAEELSPELLAQRFPQDPWARELARRLARPLGRALAGVHVDVGIERFVLLGGLGVALGPDWANMVAQEASEACWDTGQDWSRMVQTGEADSVLSGLFRMLELRCAWPCSEPPPRGPCR